MNIKYSLLALLSIASISAYADGINLKDCPAPVQQTVQANNRGGALDEIEVVTIENRSLYVADYDLPNDQSLKVHVDGDGKLLKTSEDVDVAELPAAVGAAAQKLVPAGGKLSDVDKEVADGKTTYLVEIDRPDASDLEVVLAEDGAVVSQKEEAND